MTRDRTLLVVLLASLGASVAALPGCGKAVDSKNDPSVARLRGLVSGKISGVSHPVRVVLVWQSAAQDHRRYALQETTLEPRFPAAFELAVTDRPPAAAFMDLEVPSSDRKLHKAVGTVAVYEDLNDNGHFDLVPPGGTQAIDRLLSDGNRAQVSVVYYEGSAEDIVAWGDANVIQDTFTSVPPPRLPSPHPGLNIYNQPDWPPTGDGCKDAPCTIATNPAEWIHAPATEIELVINEPALSVVQCAEVEYSQSLPTDCPGNVPPDGWGALCISTSNPHDVLMLSPHEPGTSLCRFTTQYCEAILPDPLPLDWPCPTGS